MEGKQEGEASKSEPVKAAEPDAGTQPRKGGRKKIVVAGSVLIALTAVGAAAYGGGVFYYKTHFLPNTSINGIDCSNLKVEEVVGLLDGQANGYVLEVKGRDYKTGDPGAVLGAISPEEIHLVYTGTLEAVEAFLEQQEIFGWIQAFIGKNSFYSMEQGISFDEELLKSVVEAWDACKKENMLKPVNAYIGEYSELDNRYEIIAETNGAELDVSKLLLLVSDTVVSGETVLDAEESGCYAEAAIKKDNKTLTEVVDKINCWLNTKITYDWNGTEVILDHETLKDWISVEDGQAVLDEEQVAEFIKTQAKQYDTYGKKRKFTTSLGVELTLPSGYYGWKTDREKEKEELIELIYQGTVTDREPVYSSTAMQKGENDIGDSYVEVDITHQHVYLYMEGELILETDCVTGNTNLDRATPEGVFGVAYKQKEAVLRGRDYETPVTYWMPFYGNYGMHDAYWRSSFGGNIYKTNGSRGCVNLPPAIAEKIFGYVHKGFPVICYYYEEDPLKKQNGSGSGGSSQTSGGSNQSGTAGNAAGGENVPTGEAPAGDTTQPGTGTPAGDGTQPGAGAPAGDTTQPGTGAPAGDGTQPGTGAPAGDGTQPGTGTPAGDTTQPGADAPAGDGTQPGTDAPGGDTTQPGADAPAGDATQPGAGAPAGDGTQPGTDTPAGDAIQP